MMSLKGFTRHTSPYCFNTGVLAPVLTFFWIPSFIVDAINVISADCEAEKSSLMLETEWFLDGYFSIISILAKYFYQIAQFFFFKKKDTNTMLQPLGAVRGLRLCDSQILLRWSGFLLVFRDETKKRTAEWQKKTTANLSLRTAGHSCALQLLRGGSRPWRAQSVWINNPLHNSISGLS